MQRAENSGGELGIRTPDGLGAHTRLAGEHLRPLGQLSKMGAWEWYPELASLTIWHFTKHVKNAQQPRFLGEREVSPKKNDLQFVLRKEARSLLWGLRNKQESQESLLVFFLGLSEHQGLDRDCV